MGRLHVALHRSPCPERNDWYTMSCADSYDGCDLFVGFRKRNSVRGGRRMKRFIPGMALDVVL